MGLSNTAPLYGKVTMTASAAAIPVTRSGSLAIYNDGTSTIYIGDANVTAANGYPVAANGGQFVVDTVSSSKYYVIGTNGQTYRYIVD